MAAKKTRSSGKKTATRKASARKPRKKQAAKVARKAAGTSGRGAAARPGAGVGSVDRVAEIQRVIDVMVEAGAVEVELEEHGHKLRVRLKEDHGVPVVPFAPGAASPTVPAPGVGDGSPASIPAAAGADDPRRHVLTSPMVGTFYRATSPEAEPFVDVGAAVAVDSTICILEAMKVMNEIKAEVDGVIREILAQNGEPVEFGQPLFVIERA